MALARLWLDRRLAVVRKDGRAHFIDVSGSRAISEDYDFVASFSEGLTAAKIGKKVGFIDKTGAIAIPAAFDPETDPLPGKHFRLTTPGSYSINRKLLLQHTWRFRATCST